MNEAYELPRLKRCDERGKITINFNREIKEIYDLGKANGWDTPRMIKDLVTEFLLERAETLKQSAERSA